MNSRRSVGEERQSTDRISFLIKTNEIKLLRQVRKRLEKKKKKEKKENCSNIGTLLLAFLYSHLHPIHYTVLYCTVLYCTVLYCTVLYCTVLYCTVMQTFKGIVLADSAYSDHLRFAEEMSPYVRV